MTFGWLLLGIFGVGMVVGALLGIPLGRWSVARAKVDGYRPRSGSSPKGPPPHQGNGAALADGYRPRGEYDPVSYAQGKWFIALPTGPVGPFDTEQGARATLRTMLGRKTG